MKHEIIVHEIVEWLKNKKCKKTLIILKVSKIHLNLSLRPPPSIDTGHVTAQV